MNKKEKQDNNNISTITSITSTCPICNKHHTITDPQSGEIICSNCGMVISDKIQEATQPEWRAFSTEEANTKSRTGSPTSLAYHDMGLATVIGKADRDAIGHKIDPSMYSIMKRLRTWDFRTKQHTSTDRNLYQAFNELDILNDKLALPDAVTEKTAYIYRKVQEGGFVRGRTIPAVLAAIVYLVCREIGISRTLKDIATASDVRRKTLSRMYRILVFELDLKVPLVDPMKCIAKVANKANLSESTRRKAMSIMKDITRENEILSAGKDPMGLAASVLYISSIKTGENITQENIANAAGVTGVTLRNRFKNLKSQLQLN
jgi:transcription initiation factor TFIIB